MIKRLSNRVYYMPHEERGDRPVLGLVCGDKCSLVIDAGNSPNHANEFLSEVTALGVSPVKYLALTHWHWDHVFGINTMKLITICHEKTNEKLREMELLEWDDEALDNRVKNGEEIEFCSENIKVEMPSREGFKVGKGDIIFNDRVIINLGGVNCIIENIGGDHSEDSSMIYIPSERIMFLGDSICEDIYSGEWSYSPDKVMDMIGRIKKYEVDYYITGHGEPHSAEEMNEVFDELIEAADFVDNEISFDRVSKMYYNYYGRYPNEEAVYTLNSFVNGNRKKFEINI